MSTRQLRWVFNVGAWIPNKPEWLRGISSIQEEERQRIARFVYQRDAKMALVGRLLIRRVATKMLEYGNTEFKLGRTDKGRPYLISPENSSFDFNLSHHGDLAVISAGFNMRTGVDVMRTDLPTGERSAAQFFDLMRPQFTENEWKVIRDNSLSEEMQMRYFYRHWCLKESFIKCLGTGLSYELDRIECTLSGASCPQPTVTAPDIDPEKWIFEEHNLGDSHVAAIAWHGDNLQSHDRGFFSQVKFPDLVVDMDMLDDRNSQSWTNYQAKEAHPPNWKPKTFSTSDMNTADTKC